MFQNESGYRANKINNSIDYYHNSFDRNQRPKSKDVFENYSDRLLVRDHHQQQKQQQPSRMGGCARQGYIEKEGIELPIGYADASLGLSNNLFRRNDNQLDYEQNHADDDDDDGEEDSAQNSSNRFESTTGKQQSINRNHHNFLAHTQNSNNNNSGSSSINYQGSSGVNNKKNSDTSHSHSDGGENFPPNYFTNTLDSNNYWLLNRYTRNLYQQHQASPKDHHLVMSHHRDRRNSNTLLRPYGNLSPNDMLLRSPYDSETSYNTSSFNDRTRRLNNNSNTSTNRNLLSTNLNDSYYAECKYT